MKISTWIGAACLAIAGQASAMTVEFDLLDPVSSEGQSGAYYDSLNYSSDGYNMSVSGWSSGGDRYNPFANIQGASVGMNSNGLGVEKRRGAGSSIDNFALDFDFLMFEFDRDVNVSEFNISYVPEYADTDVSLAAINGMDVWSVDNIYDANLGNNEVDLNATSSVWIIGAFHPAFGFVQDFAWDAFRIDQISVDVNPVPLPAAFWFFATGLGFIAYYRRRAQA